MIWVWVDKIKRSTTASSFTVTLSAPPEETDELEKLHCVYMDLHMSGYSVPQKKGDSSEID